MPCSQVLECSVAANVNVRHSSLRVTQLVLSQGLVHPVQIVPYLVCMSTDVEEVIAHSADKQVQVCVLYVLPNLVYSHSMHCYLLPRPLPVSIFLVSFSFIHPFIALPTNLLLFPMKICELPLSDLVHAFIHVL